MGVPRPSKFPLFFNLDESVRMPLHRRQRWLLLAAALLIFATVGSWKVGYLDEESIWQLHSRFQSSLPGHKPSNPEILTQPKKQQTTIPTSQRVHGFTVLDNLYLRNGVFYIMTEDKSKFPPTIEMLSKPLDLGGKDEDMVPTDKELQYVTPEEASKVLGEHDVRIADTSVIVYDPPQFMKHYYHWWGEIMLGVWRALSTVPDAAATSPHFIEPPARFLLPFTNQKDWRDRAGVDGPYMRAAFPNAAIEEDDWWQDYINLNVTVAFDRVLLVNRYSAHRHPNNAKWFKMVAGTMDLTVPTDFWLPLQQTFVRNLLGYVPDPAHAERPVVTYISRQGSGRKLRQKDHEGLVAALGELQTEGLIEFRAPQMELLSLKEQIELAASSSILVGVHGNGLTHQLWMPRSAHSSVFEIFDPTGYIFDYEMLARNVGHRHYAVWNDTTITYPPGTYRDGVTFTEHFHGDSIPVHGPTIAEKIRERLAEKS